ncbi:hypothetical protein GUH04_23160 [Xanthomonas citri pv. citri]|nr:hypothetical protein [Xanthomonas citri pv. citri]
MDLRTLGYSQQQQEKIKPKVRSTVAQHHEALVGHGFTRAHRCAQPTPGSVRDRRCQVSGHDRSVARGDTRSDRWRRQTVVRRALWRPCSRWRES